MIGLIIIFLMLVSSVYVLIPSGNGITRSTVKRTKLSSGLVQDVGWYVDELGWIKSSTNMTSGLRHFYNKTGVKPYLFITDSINGQSPQATSKQAEELMDQYAQSMYDYLINDEAHILIIFYEYDGEYLMWHVTGKMAQTVMDGEAIDILLDYIEHWYYRDVNEDTMFSNAFRDAGDRIMQVYRSPAIYIIFASLGVIALIIAFTWWRKRADHKLAELKETNEILKTPLDTVLSGGADDLAKKYEGVDS